MDSFFERRCVHIFLILWIALIAVWCARFTTGYFQGRLGTRSYEIPDAFDYAQIGREIVRGNGMSTKHVFPRHIGYLAERKQFDPKHVPNLFRYPLPTISNSIAQRFIDDPVTASVVQCGIWFLASIPIFFLLARSLFAPALALVCTFLFAARPGVWLSSYNGMAESSTIFLLLLFLLLIVRGRDTLWSYAGLGITGALLCLVRTQFAYVIVIGLAYIAIVTPKQSLVRALGSILIAFLAAMSPWMIRNIQLTGNPLFSFHNSRVLLVETTPMYSDLEMQLHAPANLFGIVLEKWPLMLGKFWRNFSNGLFGFTSAIGVYIYTVIGLAILFRVIKNRETSAAYEKFKWLALATIGVNTLIASLVLPEERFSYPIQPLLLLVLAQELLVLVRKPLFQQVALVALLIFGGATFGKNVVAKPDEREDPICARMREIVKPTDVVATDISHKVALLDDVFSIRLPHHPADLLEISEKYVPVDYVLISPRLLDDKPTDRASMYKSYVEYRDFIRSAEFLKKYKLAETIPPGWLLYKRNSD